MRMLKSIGTVLLLGLLFGCGDGGLASSTSAVTLEAGEVITHEELKSYLEQKYGQVEAIPFLALVDPDFDLAGLPE